GSTEADFFPSCTPARQSRRPCSASLCPKQHMSLIAIDQFPGSILFKLSGDSRARWAQDRVDPIFVDRLAPAWSRVHDHQRIGDDLRVVHCAVVDEYTLRGILEHQVVGPLIGGEEPCLGELL